MRGFSCLICASVFLLFICSTALPGEQAYVAIDSLSGKAEVQRAGHRKWVPVRKEAKLHNNDILCVLEKSLARLKWENGSVMYVHANSQILVNLHEDTVHNIFSKHATVFFGAVFFVVREAAPRAMTKRFDTKVFTPTAVIAIRGTSFRVGVDKGSGETQVGTLNGTILVGNILRRESIFLSAGYKTTIAMNAEPVVPKALLDKEIEALKIWVPPPVVVAEMSRQIARARRDYHAILGKLEDKLVVLPFGNSSRYRGEWNISGKLASFVAQKIGLTNREMIVTFLSDSDIEADPIDVGMEQKARFVVVGDIKNFDIVQRAEINAAADDYRELSVAQVRVRLQVIDVANQRLIFDDDILGETTASNKEANRWKHISELELSLKDQAFSSSILGKAIKKMLEQSSNAITRYTMIE